jgi:L-asparaginase
VNARPLVSLITTGGTIAMRPDPKAGGNIPRLKGRDLLTQVPGTQKFARIRLLDFALMPAMHYTPARLWELVECIRREVKDPKVSGVVVAQGTDTLEETSYLFELATRTEKPIVVTGAMRTSAESGWDGPSNLLDSARVAASKQARGQGALVVLNGTIHSSKEVIKLHTSALETFHSLDFGPLGYVDEAEVIFKRRMAGVQHIPAKGLEPNVDLIKAGAGMDGRLIYASIQSGARGLVVEATGRGHVTPAILEGIRHAVSAGIPTIVVSRCPSGRVFPAYGFQGGGVSVKQAGAILADYLSGPKARIKLMLALSVTRDLKQIEKLFQSP